MNVSCFESKIRQHTGQDLETKIFFVPEAIGSALHYTNLVVQTFYEPKRDFVFGLAEGSDCWDRNTARAVLSGELPIHAPFRYVQWVPNSTMTHVSASPPFHPGRSDFPSPVGDLDHLIFFPIGPSRSPRNLSANSHTLLM